MDYIQDVTNPVYVYDDISTHRQERVNHKIRCYCCYCIQVLGKSYFYQSCTCRCNSLKCSVLQCSDLGQKGGGRQRQSRVIPCWQFNLLSGEIELSHVDLFLQTQIWRQGVYTRGCSRVWDRQAPSNIVWFCPNFE